jgi:penicillin amidase
VAARSAIGFLGAAGLGSFGLWYQLFRRPLPQTRGTTTVHGLDAPVEIGRDRFGVPRIQAHSATDLCFGHGFCHGQERLWQMELYRRIAYGRLAELVGPEALPADRFARTFGFGRIARREAARDESNGAVIGAAERELLDAYSAGVNAAIEQMNAPPLELQLLRGEPEPWSPADTLAVGKILALGLATNMEQELLRADLVRRIGPELTARLEPNYPRGNPVVATPGEGWSGAGAPLAEQIAAVRELIGLSPQPAGSNNWAVSGERSATGAPLLAGDPHLSATMPCIWYACELSTPEVELRGASMPGVPGIALGQTRHVAWSFTNVMADVQDLFVEHIRDGEDGRPEYEFEGEWRPVTVHREEIHARGRDEPELLEVRETHHGPVVTDALGSATGEPLALAWTALRHPSFISLQLEAGDVRSGAEMIDRFRDYKIHAFNLVWADSGGNIGYKLVGALPRRRGDVPDVPKPGWTGEYEWDGYVPFEELPEIVNPEGGVIVTANNQVAADDYPHHITSEYLDGFRAARIEQLLSEKDKLTLDDFERIQVDLYSIPGERTAHRLARLRPSGQREVRAIERLKSWDHVLDSGTIAGTIYQAFTVHFGRLVAEAAIGHEGDADRWQSKSLLGFTPVNSAPWRWQARLLELWDEGDRELIGGRSWDDLALDALSAALDELEQRWGADPSGWRWGRVHGLRFAHALGSGHSPVSKVLERVLSRRVPAGGAQETVAQIGYVAHDGDYTGVWCPSYRLLADLGAPSRSRWQHTTGQSGHPGSPHYDDLVQDWLAGRTNPVAQPAEESLRLVPA